MTKIEIAKELLKGHSCNNCRFENDNLCLAGKDGKFSQEGKKLPNVNVCKFWDLIISLASDLIRVVRRAYPSTIANDIVSVQPMSSPKETIYSIDLVYRDEKKIEKER